MAIEAPAKSAAQTENLVEMAWDPITRIVGSLGIYTKIDWGNKKVVECHSTSSIFRGYSIFMKGKDPRDAHFITSRICGICGDNHATCSVYNQNMAYGVTPPHLGEWIINLGEAAEFMFDHNIFQENLVGVDFCEKMVSETNPGVMELANRTEAPHAADHGYKTIGDIMRSLNPFEGAFYREALQVSRYTREMFCLMEGRHVHPSTLYPGGVGTTATIQLFTDYYIRLMRYVEFMKRVVPMHDDLFDFFYEAMPGYEEVGNRRILLNCWGAFNDPDVCNFDYKDMTAWGRAMFVTPGIVVDGKLVTNDLVKINLGIRILLGSSFYDGWEDQETFVKQDPLGNPVSQDSPWNQTTIPKPQKRDFDGKYSWVMSPRWYHEDEPGENKHLAMDTGGGPLARLWSTALSGLVDIGFVKATGTSVQINLPRTALLPEKSFEWKIPKWSNTIERDRARTYFQAYAAACALHFIEKAIAEIRAGHTKTWNEFKVPDEAIGVGFTEAVRGVLSHHMVIRGGKIANYHPYPPTPWNANPRDKFGTPGPVRGRGPGPADLRGERSSQLQGDRHHANRPQLRSVPAVRRPHVRRRREHPGAAPLAGDDRPVVTIAERVEPERAAAPARGPALGRSAAPAEGTGVEEPLDARRVAERINGLVADLSGTSDPRLAEKAEDLVGLLMQFYGAGLRRMLQLADEAGALDGSLLDGIVADELVSSILILHDLHPVDLATRVQAALDRVRPYLGSHGGDVEILGIDGDVVRLRMEGSCSSCPSSTVTLNFAIEEAILKAAPEISRIEAEGVEAPADTGPLIQLMPRGGATVDGGAPKDAGPAATTWLTLDPALDVAEATPAAIEIGGLPVVVCRSGADLYAYRDRCPNCRSHVADGRLRETVLACRVCGHAFDIRRAGRSTGDDSLHLDPLPLLIEGGQVRIAVPVAAA